MKTDSQGRPYFSFRVYLFVKFTPLYLAQDTINHAAAGNLKNKIFTRNKFP